MSLHLLHELTLSPPPGVVVNSKTKLLELKKKMTTLILGKLRMSIPFISRKHLMLIISLIEILTGATVTCMEYDRFNELITARHQIVVKNWPLEKFCNPSNIASRIELKILHNAWQSGTTHFQKLTREEMEAWENNLFSSRMESMLPPAEHAPGLASTQTPAEMVLFSELPCQEYLDVAPALPSQTIPNIPLAPITNLATESTSTATPCPPVAPDPDMIARMIQADPALQNVDPTLIAMGITEANQRRATMTTTACQDHGFFTLFKPLTPLVERSFHFTTYDFNDRSRPLCTSFLCLSFRFLSA